MSNSSYPASSPVLPVNRTQSPWPSSMRRLMVRTRFWPAMPPLARARSANALRPPSKPASARQESYTTMSTTVASEIVGGLSPGRAGCRRYERARNSSCSRCKQTSIQPGPGQRSMFFSRQKSFRTPYSRLSRIRSPSPASTVTHSAGAGRTGASDGACRKDESNQPAASALPFLFVAPHPTPATKMGTSAPTSTTGSLPSTMSLRRVTLVRPTVARSAAARKRRLLQRAVMRHPRPWAGQTSSVAPQDSRSTRHGPPIQQRPRCGNWQARSA